MRSSIDPSGFSGRKFHFRVHRAQKSENIYRTFSSKVECQARKKRRAAGDSITTIAKRWCRNLEPHQESTGSENRATCSAASSAIGMDGHGMTATQSYFGDHLETGSVSPCGRQCGFLNWTHCRPLLPVVHREISLFRVSQVRTLRIKRGAHFRARRGRVGKVRLPPSPQAGPVCECAGSSPRQPRTRADNGPPPGGSARRRRGLRSRRV